MSDGAGERPTIRAAVFDLDGTMFDTEALYFRVASAVVGSRGRSFTREIMRAMIGRQGHESRRAFQSMTGLDEPIDAVLDEIRAQFNAEIDTAVHPTSGLFALLGHLAERDIPCAVATSSRRAYAERLLVRHGLIDRFRFFLGAEDVTRHKPDPEIYLTAADRLGVPTASVLVLEDTPTGLAAALRAGTFAVGVPHDQSPAEDLHTAHLIVPTLADPSLLALLDPLESEP